MNDYYTGIDWIDPFPVADLAAAEEFLTDAGYNYEVTELDGRRFISVKSLDGSMYVEWENEDGTWGEEDLAPVLARKFLLPDNFLYFFSIGMYGDEGGASCAKYNSKGEVVRVIDLNDIYEEK